MLQKRNRMAIAVLATFGKNRGKGLALTLQVICDRLKSFYYDLILLILFAVGDLLLLNKRTILEGNHQLVRLLKPINLLDMGEKESLVALDIILLDVDDSELEMHSNAA